MLIREWMTKKVISIPPETSLLKATKLMKDHQIRRLPVVDGQNRVVGIVSDRDIKAASPSKMTTLDMHELQYLLSEIKIRDIMTHSPSTLRETDTVDSAAALMVERSFGGLPIVDNQEKLIGIITDYDIFKVLVEVSGSTKGGLQLGFCLPDEPGVLCPLFELFREHKANVISVLTARQFTESGTSRVYIRLYPMEPEAEKNLVEALKASMPLKYWLRGESLQQD